MNSSVKEKLAAKLQTRLGPGFRIRRVDGIVSLRKRTEWGGEIEIADFYPEDDDSFTVTVYLWERAGSLYLADTLYDVSDKDLPALIRKIERA